MEYVRSTGSEICEVGAVGGARDSWLDFSLVPHHSRARCPHASIHRPVLTYKHPAGEDPAKTAVANQRPDSPCGTCQPVHDTEEFTSGFGPMRLGMQQRDHVRSRARTFPGRASRVGHLI